MSRLSKRARRRERGHNRPPAAPPTTLNEGWLQIDTAPEDNFVLYRLISTGETMRGCIDFFKPTAVWSYDRDLQRGDYYPKHLFDGWRKVSPEQIIGVVRPEMKKPPWGPA